MVQRSKIFFQDTKIAPNKFRNILVTYDFIFTIVTNIVFKKTKKRIVRNHKTCSYQVGP